MTEVLRWVFELDFLEQVLILAGLALIITGIWSWLGR